MAEKACHRRPGRGYFSGMKKILWTASDAIVLTARLYRELAMSALSLLPSRPIREF